MLQTYPLDPPITTARPARSLQAASDTDCAGFVVFTCLPFQSTPLLALDPSEVPQYQMRSGVVGGDDEGAGVREVRGVGVSVGAVTLSGPVRNDHRTLICLCSPLPDQSSWSSET